ncbi:hypothetical protein [Streptomyces sp. NPDC008150]|uniref:hypothetical protein n=1 Tax=Streptomyces sp. NPDC008150 TaxID=3364816 RepID=UPI0036E468C2
MGGFGALSVRQLGAVVERVAPHDPEAWEGRDRVRGAGGVMVQVSQEQARQLWMVLGMLDRAVGREEMPAQADGEKVGGPLAEGDDADEEVREPAAQLFTPPALRAFWSLTVAGELRRWEKDLGKPLPVATQRTIRTCLKMLAGLVLPAGKQALLPELDVVELKPPVPRSQLPPLYRELVALAGDAPLDGDGLGIGVQERARLLALVSVVLDTGARVGELAAMNVADLGPELEWVRVVRRPQHASTRYAEVASRLEVSVATVRRAVSGGRRMSEQLRTEVLREIEDVAGPRVERYALREGTRVAVTRWLDVREGLVSGADPVGLDGGLEGGRSGLWVTVAPSKAGPAGIRIQADGLGQSYARGVTALNGVMAGQYGWEPLPVRMEQLRRAVDVLPLEEEEQPV